jgi:hypothetical protein
MIEKYDHIIAGKSRKETKRFAGVVPLLKNVSEE